jgi:hypothetical protein
VHLLYKILKPHIICGFKCIENVTKINGTDSYTLNFRAAGIWGAGGLQRTLIVFLRGKAEANTAK